jgi:hypothetical protein
VSVTKHERNNINAMDCFCCGGKRTMHGIVAGVEASRMGFVECCACGLRVIRGCDSAKFMCNGASAGL